MTPVGRLPESTRIGLCSAQRANLPGRTTTFSDHRPFLPYAPSPNAVNDYRRRGRARVARRARRVLRVFPSIPLTCVLLPPGQAGHSGRSTNSLSRQDNGFFQSIAGKESLTALPLPCPLPRNCGAGAVGRKCVDGGEVPGERELIRSEVLNGPNQDSEYGRIGHGYSDADLGYFSCIR